MKYNNSIGVIRNLPLFFRDEDEEIIGRMLEEGIETVQLLCGDFDLMTPQNAEKLLKKLEGKMRVTSVWCSWTGPGRWNFVDGPGTLGLVPSAYRGQRLNDLKKGADFAKELGVHDMATHVGFIPEQPCYEGYRDLVSAVYDIAYYCNQRDISFNFETGQETPTTLMRVFQDVGAENLGVNLDPANLIMYGRGNPVDAIDIYGDKIKGVHVKDGDYPKDDYYSLGKERVVGEGSVNYPVFLPKLLKSGYKGDLYIEREIRGEQQLIDILKTVHYVKKLMEETE